MKICGIMRCFSWNTGLLQANPLRIDQNAVSVETQGYTVVFDCWGHGSWFNNGLHGVCESLNDGMLELSPCAVLYILFWKQLNQKPEWLSGIQCCARRIGGRHTTGESEDHTSEKTCKKRSTLALKLRTDLTRSPKQGYQWPHEKDLCPPKIKKKMKKKPGSMTWNWISISFAVFLNEEGQMYQSCLDNFTL